MPDLIGNERTSARFLHAVRLDEIGEGDGTVSFEGVPQYVPWPKAYGGDSVAQALAAAISTVEADRTVNSFHAYFVQPVTVAEPVRYDVALTRDGRSYSTRQVTGSQNGRETFLATVSFAATAEGDDFFEPIEGKLTEPQNVPSATDALAGFEATSAADYWAHGRGFDIRHADGHSYGPTVPRERTQQRLWLKSFSDVPAALQQVALAYVCDYTILETPLAARGLGWSASGLVTASLDHAMWFHRPIDVNRWFLYVQDAVSVQSDRGLARGRFYQDGALVATVMQEGVIRVLTRPASRSTT